MYYVQRLLVDSPFLYLKWLLVFKKCMEEKWGTRELLSKIIFKICGNGWVFISLKLCTFPIFWTTVLQWSRKIFLNYNSGSNMLDTIICYNNLLQTGECSCCLEQNILLSMPSFLIQFYILYLVYLIIMLRLVWKHLFLILKFNCAPLSSCLAAFEILGDLGCGDSSTFSLCQFFLSFLSNAISSVL